MVVFKVPNESFLTIILWVAARRNFYQPFLIVQVVVSSDLYPGSQCMP